MRRIMQNGAELILEEQPTRTLDFVPFGDTSRLSASMMYVPLRREGQPVGVLAIYSYTPNAYTRADLLTLQALADHFGGALERIQAEASLRESEERYRSLVNNLNVGVYRNTPGPHGRFLQANAALARMHGYDSVEELQKARASDLYQQPADREALMADLLRQGTVLNYEVQGKKRDGTAINVSLSATVHRGPQGEVDWIDGVAEDITERKHAERRLAEALDLNRKMIAVSSVGIAAYKATGECVFANEALARIVGGSSDEMLKNNFRQSEVWRSSGKLTLAEEVLRQGQSRCGEFYGTSRFGKVAWQDCHLATFVSGGQPHLLEIAQDITERKRVEDSLKLQSLVMQNMAEGAMLVGQDQTILFANAALEATFGYEPGELIGQNVAVLNTWSAEETARFNAEVIQTVEHEGVWFGEYQNRRKDGTLFTSEARVRPLDLEGRRHFVAVQQDVTERRRLERQILEISDREQARIGQDIHDGLCQQLVSLAFDANSLHGDLSRQHRPEAARASRIARYLDQAITETRQLSRGLFPIRLEEEGLVPALEELARVTRERFQIGCRLTSRKPVAVENRVVATHLYRIAQEAVANAVKHSRARKVAIRLRARAGQIELRVEDDGTGLPAAKPDKSAGLGLHIMDYRARSIGGALRLAPGSRGGTAVSCCVPCPLR
jgi:PAS domain S-box-containing protein